MNRMEGRIKLVFVFFCIWLFVIGAKLWYMQVLEQGKFQKLSTRNRTRIVRLPSGRGKIYDREGRILADNKAATQLIVMADNIENIEDVQNKISGVIDLSPEYILKKIKENLYRPFIPAVLASNMSEETLVSIAEAKWQFPGIIDIQIVPIRDYVLKDIAAHLIGYVSQVGKGDLEDGYILGDIIGRTGIEEFYDKDLQGENGYKEMQVDYKGSIDKVLGVVPPETGNSIYLNIDLDLQEELFNAMENKRGAGVVINAQTGEVLALISIPSFDPNLLISPVKQSVLEDVFMNKEHPLINRAISGLYPPGSIFKIIVALAALEQNSVTNETLFYCDGVFSLGNTNFRCWKKEGHGWMDLSNALKRSCNIYFYQTGLKCGPKSIVQMAERFGLGKRTGIDLPGEKTGALGDEDLKRNKWYAGDTVNLSIGHGKILVTPMQMAVMIAAIGNGGILYKPELFSGAESEGSVIEINEELVNLVKQGLFRVVNESSGTGHTAFIEGVDAAGKTGTVELKEDKKNSNICWFAGFAPYKDPEIAVVVVIEEGDSGGRTAAPVAKRVLKKWYDKKTKTINMENELK